MIIRKVAVEDLQREPNLAALLSGYADEAKIADLPEHRPNWVSYANMERLGILHIFAAYAASELVGFISILSTVVPHYAERVASTESFYVHPDHRKGGTGRKLIAAAEECAKGTGAVALFVSAPHRGRLESVLPSFGFKRTNTVFFRSLA